MSNVKGFEILMAIYSLGSLVFRASNDSRTNELCQNADTVNRLAASGMYAQHTHTPPARAPTCVCVCASQCSAWTRNNVSGVLLC